MQAGGLEGPMSALRGLWEGCEVTGCGAGAEPHVLTPQHPLPPPAAPVSCSIPSAPSAEKA